MDIEKPTPPVSRLLFNEELVWLVKIPNYLADSWLHAERGTELGTVSLIHKDPSTEPEVEMTVRPLFKSNGQSPTEEVPLEFSCQYSKLISNEIKIFSEDVPGNITFEGLVNIKVDCSAKDSVLLGKALNTRAMKTKEDETHDLKVFEEKDVDTFVAKAAVITNKLTGNKNNKVNQPKKKGEKRERMDKENLRNLIFEAFYEKNLLTLAELDRLLQQPVAFLKEVLTEICIYHTSGKDRLHYEIKDEFKSKKQKLERSESLNNSSDIKDEKK